MKNNHEDYQLDNYYVASTDIPSLSQPLTSDTLADVCIIGGGFTGLGAALTLAELGVDVVLLESGRIAGQAAGCNGGQLHTGWRCYQGVLEKKVGLENAHRLWRLAEKAKDYFHNNCARYAIDCDWQKGMVMAGHTSREVRGLQREAKCLQTNYDYQEIKPLGRDALRAEIGSNGYLGGTIDWGGGHLHPLKYALGLARAAGAKGARIYENTPAGAIKIGAKNQVETPNGTVTCQYIIHATNGIATNLDRRVAGFFQPLSNYIVTTEPLGGEIDKMLPNRVAVADTYALIRYWRPTGDGRLLFGGGEVFNKADPADIREFVRPYLTRAYPLLAKAKLEYGWGGKLGITVERLPVIKQIDNGFFIGGGFSGQGVMLAPYIGHILGQVVSGDRELFDYLQCLPRTRFPGGKWLGKPLLSLALRLASLSDRIPI